MFLIFLWAYDAKAQWSLLDKELDAIIQQEIYLVHKENYKESIQSFKRLIRLHPDEPIGYFFVAAVYQTIMRNYRTRICEREFEKYLDLAIRTGETSIKQDEDNSLNYFYLGAAYGYRGLHKFFKRNWIGAYFDGRKGIKNLKMSLKKDPNLYDTYYGLGVFHYWLGVKPKIIRYLFFYRGDCQQGINELEIALKRGKYTNIESKFALMIIYYLEKKYDKALLFSQELYGHFPSNPSCLYVRSRIFEKQKNWKEAKLIMQKLLCHLVVSEYRCVCYEAECHYRIAYFEFKLGNFESARNQCLETFRLKDKRNPDKELEGPFETFQQIQEKSKRLYDILNPSPL